MLAPQVPASRHIICVRSDICWVPHKVQMCLLDPVLAGLWAEGNPMHLEDLQGVLNELIQHTADLRDLGLDTDQVCDYQLCHARAHSDANGLKHVL